MKDKDGDLILLVLASCIAAVFTVAISFLILAFAQQYIGGAWATPTNAILTALLIWVAGIAIAKAKE